MIYDICIPLHGNFIWADENYISLLFSRVPHFQTNPDSLDPLDHLFFFFGGNASSRFHQSVGVPGARGAM